MNALVTINDAADDAALSSALAKYASEILGTLPGDRLKFAKGTWSINDVPVPQGQRLVAHLSTITQCWERWEGKRIADRIVAPLGDRLPPRETLGHSEVPHVEAGTSSGGGSARPAL